MNTRILETNNYGRFELTPFNRDVKKTKRLEALMRREGWIDAYPVHAIRNGNGKLLIKDGHHRFVVAQRLSIPIKYVECKDNATMHELITTINRWSIQDFLDSYVKEGKEVYLAVMDYHKKTGITLTDCISLLAGDSAGTANWNTRFKDGSYRLGNLSHSRVVAAIITQAKESGYPCWNKTLFVQAVSKVARAEGFASEVLKEKIKTFSHFMEKQGTKQDYIEMLDSIYNRQSHTKIPLAFLAEEAARKRNVVKYGL